MKYAKATLGIAITLVFLMLIKAFADGRENTLQAQRINALEIEMQKISERPAPISGTSGTLAERDSMISEIKRQLENEMGLLSPKLMRERHKSFVELKVYGDHEANSYGTAGYLGNNYFITVKHALVALDQDSAKNSRKIKSVKLVYKNKPLIAQIIDIGEARTEVDPGDWAILKVSETIDLPPLTVNLDYKFELADPIFRLGNDYSKGIILATGYVGQRLANNLVTALTDGHPGVSGGGVLNSKGEFVGIPVGRMLEDYRFSFILPLRKEMFRKVPFIIGP